MEQSFLRLLLLSFLLAASALAQSVNLSQFQQINGFPASCTQAYNSPIPGCTAKDFTNNNPCSQSCIAGLQQVTILLNQQCRGVSTSTSTLIGLFFDNKGVQALCPSASSGGVKTSQQPPPTKTSTPVVATSPPPQATPQTTMTLAVISSSAPQISLSAPPQVSSSVQPSQAPSSAMATANPNQTTPPPNTGSSSPLPNFTLSSPTSLETSTQPASSTANPNSFGGSVDPFGGNASEAPTAAISVSRLAGLIAGTMFLIWLL